MCSIDYPISTEFSVHWVIIFSLIIHYSSRGEKKVSERVGKLSILGNSFMAESIFGIPPKQKQFPEKGTFRPSEISF